LTDGERVRLLQLYDLTVHVKLSRPRRRDSSAADQASAAEMVGRARQAVKNDDIGAAISLCTQALALDESFPMAHAVLGVALSKRDQNADAIREIKAAVRLDHRSERFWFYLGCTYNTAKMPVPAAAAAYAGMLRDRHSTRLVRLWNEALRQILASDPTCGELSADDLGRFETIRTDLQRQYVGAATTALAEMVGQHPGCARLHYQRGAALWFLSVQGLEAHLGAACSCVARAVALVDTARRVNEALRDNVLDDDLLEQAPALYAFIQSQVPDTDGLDLARQEYSATLGELLEVVRREGAVSDMVAAATALVSHDRHDEALQLLLSSVDRILAGVLSGWYQQKAAMLRDDTSPELATERSAAETSRSLDLCLGLVWQRLLISARSPKPRNRC
jgi:tetratricopeptide (TPR) repeat protein